MSASSAYRRHMAAGCKCRRGRHTPTSWVWTTFSGPVCGLLHFSTLRACRQWNLHRQDSLLPSYAVANTAAFSLIRECQMRVRRESQASPAFSIACGRSWKIYTVPSISRRPVTCAHSQSCFLISLRGTCRRARDMRGTGDPPGAKS